MRTSLLLAAAISLLTYPDCLAQQRPSGLRPEAGLEATYWVFDAGGSSTKAQTGWGPTLRFGVRPSPGSRVSALVAVTYASEGSFDPGVAGGVVELAVRFARIGDTRRRFNGFVTAGLGALHFDADRLERQRAACGPECRFEGVTFTSGWRPVLSGGLGMDVPVSATLLMQPQAHILRPVGSATAGPEGNTAVLRVGVGLAWR